MREEQVIRVAPYYRVSRKDKEHGISIEIQQNVCVPYGQNRKYTFIDPYVDDGKSAYTENLAKRPAFQRLLADAKRNLFDAVLVYKFDRFSRKMKVALNAIDELLAAGVNVMSATEATEYKTAAGRFAVRNLLNVAELYSDMLSERMRDVRKWEAAHGRHTGPVPLGFRRECGVLVPDERIGAPQLAFQLYATRQHSFASVADALNVAGWRTAQDKPFTKYQVEEMLKNPVYVGRVRRGKDEPDGRHEPVIEATTWETVKSEIARRAATADHSHRAASQPALLSGLARCSNCGAPMWRGGRDGGYYHCSRRLRREPLDAERELYCNMRGVQAAPAEAHVLLSLMALTSNQALMAEVADELLRLATAEPTKRPNQDVRKIEEQIRRLGRLYQAGLKSDAEFEAELRVLQAQLAAMQMPATSRTPAIDHALSLLNNLPAVLGRATDEERRILLQEVFDSIYLTPHQAMAVRPAAAYTDMLKALDESSAFNQRLVLWAGWGSGLDPHTLVKMAPAVLRAA
jgi:site-specific DNA recombinase